MNFRSVRKCSKNPTLLHFFIFFPEPSVSKRAVTISSASPEIINSDPLSEIKKVLEDFNEQLEQAKEPSDEDEDDDSSLSISLPENNDNGAGGGVANAGSKINNASEQEELKLAELKSGILKILSTEEEAGGRKSER